MGSEARLFGLSTSCRREPCSHRFREVALRHENEELRKLAPEVSRSTWWIFCQSEFIGEKGLYRRLEKYAEDFHTQVLNEKYAQEYARKALLQIARDIKKDGLEDAYQKLQQHLAASGPSKGNEKGKQNVFQPTSKQRAKRRPKGR